MRAHGAAVHTRERKKLQILLSYSQAGPGIKAKQGQEEISRNHTQILFLGTVVCTYEPQSRLQVKAQTYPGHDPGVNPMIHGWEMGRRGAERGAFWEFLSAKPDLTVHTTVVYVHLSLSFPLISA